MLRVLFVFRLLRDKDLLYIEKSKKTFDYIDIIIKIVIIAPFVFTRLSLSRLSLMDDTLFLYANSIDVAQMFKIRRICFKNDSVFSVTVGKVFII